ncbi:TonB-dependent receptor [Corallococcus sp. M34]|uniref:TonB-dependent receptor domain-containing protein n=1 Tax=Citreicoccus inhibens TaxID=2849499 RepID=UPI001C2192C0|nr:TonB-dependent receptor [Citreicoccus inhibens]MBU8894590.1 TonB-dependent receptor [Citreicoccus inhibens]
MRALSLACVLMLLSSRGASAQGAAIVGTIIDAEDKQPLANVWIYPTSPALSPYERRETSTDAQGNYGIFNLPPGVYKLGIATDIGPGPDRYGLELKPGQTLRVNIQAVKFNLGGLPSAGATESWVDYSWWSEGNWFPTAHRSIKKGFTEDFARHRPSRDSGGLLRSYDSSLELFPDTRVMAGGLSLSGASPLEGETRLDGLSTMDPAYGGNALPLPDALVENLTLVTRGGLTDETRAIGANIAATTPAGGPQFHGAVFTTWTPGIWEGPRAQPQSTTGPVRRETLHQFGDLGGIVSGPLLEHRKLTFVLGAVPTFRRVARSEDVSSEGAVPSPTSTTNFLDQRAAQVMGKLEFSPSREQRLSLSLITQPTTFDDDSVTGEPLHPEPFKSTVTRTSLSWRILPLMNSYAEVEAHLGWLHRDTSRKGRVPPDATNEPPPPNDGRVEDSADRYQASLQLSHLAPGRHDLSLGVSGEYLTHEQLSGDEGAALLRSNQGGDAPGQPSSRTRGLVLGAFVQEVWSPVYCFTVSGGLRYDHERVLPADGGSSLFTGSRVSPRLGVTYARFSFIRVFAQYGMTASQVPLVLVEARSRARPSSAPLSMPTSQDLVVGMEVRKTTESRVSLQLLHRNLRSPIDSAMSVSPPGDRSYDAVTFVFGHNEPAAQEGLKALFSYTWSRLTEQGQGRVRLSPVPDASALVLGATGMDDSAPADRPHTLKAHVSWARLFGPQVITQVGLSYQGESGPLMLGAPHRLDWHHSLDAFVSLGLLKWGYERLVGGVDVFNLLNFQTVTRTDARGAPVAYQPPRQIRIQARYTF